VMDDFIYGEPQALDSTGRDAAATDGVYVGAVAGTDAYLAVTSDGDEFRGYVCDGEGLSTWIGAAPLAGATAELVTREGETIGTVTFAGGAATGTVSVAGAEHDFTADEATGDAGLYRATPGAPDAPVSAEPGWVEIGWIVLTDGTQRGVVEQDNLLRRAPRLVPGTTTSVDWGDGSPVTVGVMDPDIDF
ncbi:MAG: hypothetical protein ACRDY4_06720, partial [Acidimicrobiia bacterium]